MLHVEEISQNELFMVASLEKKIFSDAWSEKGLSDTWRQPGTVIFGVWNEKIFAGYVILYYVLDEAQIMRIAVEESSRRKGAASLLFSKVKEFCGGKNIRNIFLEVRESNIPAIQFYRKYGFRTDGIRKNFYTNPAENAILMSSKAVK